MRFRRYFRGVICRLGVLVALVFLFAILFVGIIPCVVLSIPIWLLTGYFIVYPFVDFLMEFMEKPLCKWLDNDS